MSRRPEVVVLDVNGTVSDLEPLRKRLVETGAPASLHEAWFAATLRDGFAMAIAGSYAAFSDLAHANLTTLLAAAEGLDRPPEEAAEHVLAGIDHLPVHADVPDGLRALRELGVRAVTLTNGDAEKTSGLLERAGIRELVEACMSVSEPKRWKPAAEPYRYAAERCRADPDRMLLVAVHPWDIVGASAAGLGAAWINRDGARWPQPLPGADLTAGNLAELAAKLSAMEV